MTNFRSYYDEVSGFYLVFPDAIVIRDLAVVEGQGKNIISLDVSLEASEQALASFPKSRQLALYDVFFKLSRPDDARILSFRFVRTDELKGQVVLSVLSSFSDPVIYLIKNNHLYFNPEYKGTSEDLSLREAVANVSLTTEELKQLNKSPSLPHQVFNLLKKIKKESGISENQELNLCSEFFNTHVKEMVTSSDSTQEKSWLAEFFTDTNRESILFEVKTVVKRVFFDESHATIIVD